MWHQSVFSLPISKYCPCRLLFASSVAVDFAKKGVSAPRLGKELRPEEYPHYMEKKDKRSYQSKTILGILYDKIEHYKTDMDISREEEIRTASSFPHKLFHVDGDTVGSYMREARSLKHGYDRELKRVMRQYGIEHEVEIVSGYILKFTSKQYAKETKLFELRNEIAHAYRVIQDK
jgi:RNA-dependent RNA polymerase